ncbi:MAG: hypothetical protein HND48_12570 [Chloroflexi bacterium]|nr:hypothetical protein [Chloroflexota bacterium]
MRSLYRTASAVTDAVPRGEMTANANIRLFPGAGFSRVGAASAGQEVYVMAEAESGEWVYIRVDRPRNPFRRLDDRIVRTTIAPGVLHK